MHVLNLKIIKFWLIIIINYFHKLPSFILFTIHIANFIQARNQIPTENNESNLLNIICTIIDDDLCLCNTTNLNNSNLTQLKNLHPYLDQCCRPQIVKIHLIGSFIQSIRPPDLFTQFACHQIQELIFDSTSLDSNDDWFKSNDLLIGLPNLIHFQLTNNRKIRNYTKSMFSNIGSKLKKLILSSNPVQYLNNDELLFNKMIKLEWLDLSENGLEQIGSNFFNQFASSGSNHSMKFNKWPQLTYLNLANNQLTNIKPFQFNQLVQLEYLNLDKNPIDRLEVGIFGGLAQLRNLRMSLSSIYHHQNESKLSNLKLIKRQSFLGLFDLQNLFMENFQIGEIEPNSFTDLKQLKWTNLAFNYLKTFSIDLKQKSKLISLNLSHNQIECLLPNGLIQFGKLKILDLSYNQIRLIGIDDFQGLNSLKILILIQNPLVSIDFNVWKLFKQLGQLIVDEKFHIYQFKSNLNKNQPNPNPLIHNYPCSTNNQFQIRNETNLIIEINQIDKQYIRLKIWIILIISISIIILIIRLIVRIWQNKYKLIKSLPIQSNNLHNLNPHLKYKKYLIKNYSWCLICQKFKKRNKKPTIQTTILINPQINNPNNHHSTIQIENPSSIISNSIVQKTNSQSLNTNIEWLDRKPNKWSPPYYSIRIDELENQLKLNWSKSKYYWYYPNNNNNNNNNNNDQHHHPFEMSMNNHNHNHDTTTTMCNGQIQTNQLYEIRMPNLDQFNIISSSSNDSNSMINEKNRKIQIIPNNLNLLWTDKNSDHDECIQQLGIL